MATPEQIDFASKLLESEKLIGKKTNVAYRWNFGLTALIFALLYGIIEIDENFTVSWLNLSTSFNVVVIVLSIALALAQQNCFVLIYEGEIIAKRVKKMYGDLNKNNDYAEEDDYDKLTYPDTITTTLSIGFFGNTKFGSVYFLLVVFVIGLVLQVAPIVAQYHVFAYLFSEYPCNGWVIFMMLAVALIQIVVIVSLFKQIWHEIIPLLDSDNKDESNTDQSK